MAVASIPISEVQLVFVSAQRKIRIRQPEAGVALLISIFILLLISVVAIALIVASGTESSLAGNYRSATGVYYASLAGLEEARGRLLAKDPNSFKNKAPNMLPPPGTTFDIGYASYVLNPGPADGNVLTTYPDTEYDNEFGGGALTAVVAAGQRNTTPSIWNSSPLNGLSFPGPLYKWVRINAVSEPSLGRQVAPYDGHTTDPTKPIFYDGAQLNISNSGAQVLEITALAVLPNGSQKLLQYLAAPVPIPLPPFPAALTLAGSVASSVVSYTAPASNNGFWVKGTDQDCSGSATGSKVPAVGVFNSTDTPVIIAGIPSTLRSTNYPGSGATSPDVEVIYSSFPPAMRTPAGLDAVIQSIIQNADVVITPASGPALGSSLPSSMYTPSPNPMTVVVNGDLDLTGWHNTGYGLLLVTGNLTYDPDASWNGIVMVVGQGQVTGSKNGSGEFNGAILVARTHDPSGVLLTGSNLGSSSVNFNAGSSMGGTGIRYSSCWIQKSQPTTSYNILSFHEISQ